MTKTLPTHLTLRKLFITYMSVVLGQLVTILDGPFVGLQGSISEVDTDSKGWLIFARNHFTNYGKVWYHDVLYVRAIITTLDYNLLLNTNCK